MKNNRILYLGQFSLYKTYDFIVSNEHLKIDVRTLYLSIVTPGILRAIVCIKKVGTEP